ncbi:hypothetical protein [Streptomyces kaempferi]|uniref:CMP/dCMP-type deaminase domain-containing protein n=1 Tax=Streptomyces kaempferi TaxID=333725 RepID=A0ABW3XXN0_9ACTN
MDLAVRQALRSTCRYRVGAVLAVGNRILAAGPNLRRNNPMIDLRHATFHAEEVVLRKVRTMTPGAEIFVARVNREGLPMMAQPCPRCQEALARAGIRRAHYTVTHRTVGDMFIPALPRSQAIPSFRHAVGIKR